MLQLAITPRRIAFVVLRNAGPHKVALHHDTDSYRAVRA